MWVKQIHLEEQLFEGFYLENQKKDVHISTKTHLPIDLLTQPLSEAAKLLVKLRLPINVSNGSSHISNLTASFKAVVFVALALQLQ